MIARLEQSNSQLYSNFLFSTRETLLQFAKASKENNSIVHDSSNQTTHSTSWLVAVCAILIAIACTANTIHNIWFAQKDNQSSVAEQQNKDYQDFFVSDSIANDTIAIDSVTIPQ
jgi:hypothetical protein